MLASIFGQLGQPLVAVFAWMLASFYALIPNYALAIAPLMLAVLAVLFPITLGATRGMFRLQLLAPEVRSLQAKYVAEPGMSSTERQELRQHQQQELMGMYKGNDVSPGGGCLPLILQITVLLCLVRNDPRPCPYLCRAWSGRIRPAVCPSCIEAVPRDSACAWPTRVVRSQSRRFSSQRRPRLGSESPARGDRRCRGCAAVAAGGVRKQRERCSRG
jgi:hypothetical protein